ncbi:MAG: arylesterase [Nitrospirae bacterium]|nr:arylesterase [Nitrospirota bacterium]
MWTRIFSVIFLSLLLSVIPTTGETADPEKRLIVAFGDSLTAGLGVKREESYPSLLQRRLDQLGLPYRVMNAGMTGDTTAGGVRRVAGIIRQKPGIVLLELGVNDGLRGVPLKETERNLRSIVEQLQAAGIRVVLLGMRLPPNYGADYTSGFERIFPRIAEEYRLPFVPFFLEGVAARQELNQEDGIHPTAAGYRIIEENLWSVLKQFLTPSS